MAEFLQAFIHPGFQDGHVIDHLSNLVLLYIQLNFSCAVFLALAKCDDTGSLQERQ